MKQIYAAFAITFAGAAQAQCPFTPTISPNSIILCPGEGAVLSTEPYDSYQWYKDGQPVAGATDQTHVVNAFNDGGSSFTVEATLDGCSEMSAAVLVDGWVFLLPFVMHAGDEPIDIGGSTYCEGDTALLILMPPYDINIQWTNGGVPIPGATDDTLVVTTAGNYHVSGAPSLCPSFQQQLGVTITIDFQAAFDPTIIEVGELLCIYPNDFTWHQWYLNGEAIAEGECFTPTEPGSYTVSALYNGLCGPGLSDPFIIMGTDELSDINLLASPNPAHEHMTLSAAAALHGPWRLVDMAGREVNAGRFSGCTQCVIDLSTMETGTYALVTDLGTLRVAVVR
jgi:hypothetical protein